MRLYYGICLNLIIFNILTGQTSIINQGTIKNFFSKNREGEFLIDTNVVAVSGLGDQLLPLVTFDGVNYFIIWTENRHGYSEIYGARVNQQGVLLDTSGIPIATAAESQQAPSVIYDGVNYFVVWKDYRAGHVGDLVETDIYGARVNPSGVVLDTTGILISVYNGQLDEPDGCPAVAFDGTNYFVVWQQERLNNIYGARVSQSGIVLDSTCIVISSENINRHPAIAFDGNNYFVVWEGCSWWVDSMRIYGVRISPTGVVLDTIINISNVANTHGYPAVAFDGTNYLVVWEDRSNSNSRIDIYGARVSQSGIVIDTANIPISTVVRGQRRPSIVFDGTNYFVVWQDMRNSYLDIYGARVTPSGVVLDPTGIAISIVPQKFECLPSVGFDGINYFVVWQDGRRYNHNNNIYGYDIYCARINQSGLVLDPSGISLAGQIPGSQYCSAAAFDGTNYFVVWHDYHYDSTSIFYSNIYGARVNQFGLILDTVTIGISTAPENQLYPVAAFDGTNYLVVWEDWRNVFSGQHFADIYGARISPSGIVLDTSGISIFDAQNSQSSPSIAFDGTNYLVVWQDSRNSYFPDIYGARVNPAGIVLDTSGFVIATGGYQQNASIAFDGINYLVVWDDLSDIYGSRVTQSGVVLDTLPIAISGVQGYGCSSPSVAFDGTNYLVVWHDWRNSYPYMNDIYGARISPSGIVLDTAAIAIAIAMNYQEHPSVSFDGTNYLVIWEDFRSGKNYDIYGAKITATGTVINTYEIVKQQRNQYEPALANGIGEQILITYTGWANSINNHNVKAMRIWGKFYPFTGISEDAGYKIRDSGFGLEAYPNPFSAKTTIRYTIQDSRYTIKDISLKIYDASGRLVRQWNYQTTRQSDQILWSGDDDLGRKLSAGIYFCRLEMNGGVVTQKVILLR